MHSAHCGWVVRRATTQLRQQVRLARPLRRQQLRRGDVRGASRCHQRCHPDLPTCAGVNARPHRVRDVRVDHHRTDLAYYKEKVLGERPGQIKRIRVARFVGSFFVKNVSIDATGTGRLFAIYSERRIAIALQFRVQYESAYPQAIG